MFFGQPRMILRHAAFLCHICFFCSVLHECSTIFTLKIVPQYLSTVETICGSSEFTSHPQNILSLYRFLIEMNRQRWMISYWIISLDIHRICPFSPYYEIRFTVYSKSICTPRNIKIPFFLSSLQSNMIYHLLLVKETAFSLLEMTW